MRNILGILTLIVLLLPAAAPAQEAEPLPPMDEAGQEDMFLELTPQSEEAIRAGLEYLAKTQLPNGAWVSEFGPNVGVNSLVLLAFLATGNVPEQGEYAEVIDRGINWLLARAQPSGLIHEQDGASHGPMYEHALATLYLSQIYGMSNRPEIPSVVQAAVRVIVSSQNNEGGWRYQPHSRDADISVTVMQILALRSAQRAGMHVPAETIENAIKYVNSCAVHGGGFLYQVNSGDPNYGRTGAGVTSLQVCGITDSDEVRKGLQYLMANIGQDVMMQHYHYAVYYSGQAVYLAKNPRWWQQWFPPIREQVLSQQTPEGYWPANTGNSYGTATMLLTLAIPYRYLPIYQR